MGLTVDERATLLRLARRAMEHAARTGARLEPEPEGLTPTLEARRGVFVTLRAGKELRGCVGNLDARGPLWREVGRAAYSATLRDPRFPPVGPEETERLLIEVSVLTEPVPIDAPSEDHVLAQMIPHQHGVTLKSGSRIGTFLPKVWENLGEPRQFLSHLKAKAQWGRDEWPHDAVVELYEAEDFAEADFSELGR
jgi:AmmeMemoRadiSam system protein A